MEQDPYRATAGIYDLVVEGYVDAQLAAITTFLPYVDVDHGPFLDIGCGSGRHLAYALDVFPTARAIGLEPSAAMRSLALGRLCARREWRDRVTVRPEGALEAPLPDTLGGVLMLGVFGHFTSAQRHDLLERLCARLPERGAILLDLQMPEEPVEVPRSVVADTRMGDLRYRCLAEGAPVEGEAMRWRMTYQTLSGDTVLEQHSGESIFHHPSPGLVVEEMRAHGLALTRLQDTTYWLAVRHC
ncbi:MAG: SAM-dependent methyltransferase [Actinomycetaceae bacterium]